MTSAIRTLAASVSFAVAFTAVAVAQGQQRDPLDGTWRLNLAKSKMTGGGASSSETIVFKVTATEESFESMAVQTSDGAKEHTGYKATYGGPATPMASIYVLPNGVVSRVDLAMVSVIKIDERTRERHVKGMDGQLRMRARRTISADGKTLTGAILDANGNPGQTRVFDRVD